MSKDGCGENRVNINEGKYFTATSIILKYGKKMISRIWVNLAFALRHDSVETVVTAG